MKLLKTQKHTDYVRFGFTFNTTNGKGLDFETHVNGGLTNQDIGGVKFLDIEDLDYDTNFTMFGEKTQYTKFRDFYRELYGHAKFDQLMKDIEDRCEREISSHYENSFDTLSVKQYRDIICNIIGYDKKKKTWKANKDITKTPHVKITDGEGGIYWTSNWYVKRIFKSLADSQIKSGKKLGDFFDDPKQLPIKEFITNNCKYQGIEIHDVLNLIERTENY
jgi:hypothetical protein